MDYTALYQTQRRSVCSNNLRDGTLKQSHSHPEYQIDKPLENHQNWFDNCPVARTRE